MNSLRVLRKLGLASGVGMVTWPQNNPENGFCSAQATKIVGAKVRSIAEFAMLVRSPAGFLAAAAAQSDFRIEIALSDGRLIELTAVVEGTGNARLLHGAIEDISRRINDRAVQDELCRAMAENSPAMLWMGDQNGKCVFLNKALRTFWGVDPDDLSQFDWGSTTHPDDLAKLAGPFVKAMTEHTPFSVEARYRRADGQYRTMLTDAEPRFDLLNGAFLGMTGVNTDITDRLKAEEHTRMLMGELNHRTKNILAVVQAVARQTARDTSIEEFNKTFNDRLMGLAANNDLLLRNDWGGAEIGDLVEAQLKHLGDLLGQRILASGPRLRIAASAAQTLGMAFHELATNSLKYGALSGQHGVVELSWTGPEAGSACPLTISWKESGVVGVARPTRKGFGHSVTVDMVAATFDADVDIDFRDSGFRWTVSARSERALAD